ncbi:hypothetical protein BOX15_Mlig028497g2 [Macrostomum lignano]|uniref:RIIa domain-containing protein n=2 Tax=Macrostomum lignano TaxID=282301 RepID=A0A1I8I933_9PLAT|nr:hypothetical protein BOX15_Mlig028497g1 [Macrostomum lignano]PAA77570.1 hypothetical protein BOX15_Mlig028497g2 [Macrostomum lignano]
MSAGNRAAKPRHDPPHSMEPYDLGGGDDLGALSEDQQRQLNEVKIKKRLANEAYLRAHPEIDCLISGFLQEAFIRKPANVREFAAEYFTDSALPDRVEAALDQRRKEMDMNNVLRQVHRPE